MSIFFILVGYLVYVQLYGEDMRALSQESDKIAERLTAEGIENLYHFTRVVNLSKISEHNALCSREYLESCGDWVEVIPGGNELSRNLDVRNGNRNRIHLNLTPQTPMFYNTKVNDHWCFLIISTEVAKWNDSIFTDSNAASNDYNFDSIVELLLMAVLKGCLLER